MADSDKNIIIRPNRGATGSTGQPQIRFVGQNADPITLRVLDITGSSAGAISFEGSAGQLFSITNSLTSGSIFSVNDISGLPSIDVNANGTILFAGFTGNVGIGATAGISGSAQRLTVVGGIHVTGGASNIGGTLNMNTNLIRDLEMRDYYETLTTPTFSGGVLTCDLNSSQVFTHTLHSSINRIVLSNVPTKTNTVMGFTLVVKQGTTGGNTAAFSGISGATTLFANNEVPVMSTGANKTDIVSYVTYDNGSNWFGFLGGQNF